jgi:AraC family transcriptional regulator
MSIADRALWTIERNLNTALSLADIADACGVSRSHLAAAFGTAVGQPVMKYLRARRLSEAACALADGASDILSVALENGYASHEAFTRAFKEQFGVTPETVRTRKTVEGLSAVIPSAFKLPSHVRVAAPRISTQPGMRFVGLAESCSFEKTAQIPAQWQRFMEFYGAIPHKQAEIPVGLAHPVDDDGRFSYMCAVEVSRFGATPKPLTTIETSPQTYAVFEHRGHVSTIYATYTAIWNEALPAIGFALADSPVLERHNETFDTRTGEGGLTLWIPVTESHHRGMKIHER